MEKNYWEPEIETMPWERLKQLQEERLRALVKRVYQDVPFYRRRFDEVGVKPEEIDTLADVAKLPLTEYMRDFVATPLEQKLAVPWNLVTEIGSTSGTLSGFTQPLAVTEGDVEADIALQCRSNKIAGVEASDTVQLLIPLDFIVPTLKEAVSRVILSMAGRMTLDHQIKLAKVVGTTVLLGFPSQVLRFVTRAREIGIDIKRDTSLRLALLSGEPLATPVKKRLEKESGMALYEQYGFAEASMRGPIACECSQRDGLHVWADRYLVEVIDPETLEVLAPGEEGELVVTTLTKEAMPLIRYRTGDVAKILGYEPCPCGRTHPKIASVGGRVEHLIKVKGIRLLPGDIEDFIIGMSGLGNEYRIIIDKEGELERLKVRVEHAPGVEDLHALKQEVEAAFEQSTSLSCQIELVPPGALPQTQFKAQRLIKTYRGEK
jgi:phenylacetate-CoA ligase